MTFFTRTLMLLMSIVSFQLLADDAVQLKTQLDKLESFSAEFAQTVIDEQGEAVHEATGHITMKRPDKLRWETDFPDETLLIADGNTVWHVDYFVEQVTLMSQQKAVENNPMVLLTSDESEVWAKYTVKQLGPNEFTVMAKTGAGQIRALTLSFDEKSLIALQMTDSQGQNSHILFSQRKVNIPVDETAFVSEISPEFMVDDQR